MTKDLIEQYHHIVRVDGNESLMMATQPKTLLPAEHTERHGSFENFCRMLFRGAFLLPFRAFRVFRGLSSTFDEKEGS